MTEPGTWHTAPVQPSARRGCRRGGVTAGLFLIVLVLCVGGGAVGLAVVGVLMLEGYLPAAPPHPPTATITRVPTPLPTTRAPATSAPAMTTPTATATGTAAAPATAHATDVDVVWPDETPVIPSATPSNTLTPTGAPAETTVPTPTDTLTPIGAPARTTTPTTD